MATTFAYKVRNSDGKVLTGTLDADNTALVANKLRAMGYTPIAIDQKAAVSFKTEITIPGLSNRVKLKDLSVFCRQFATMIDAGLTLLRSLAILAEQADNKYFGKIIDEIRLDVEQGLSLSQALAKHPKHFSNLFVAMVKAGEASGSLDRTLLKLADTLESQVELRGKIRSAMAYPVAVLCLVMLIMAAMLLFIVPIFSKMYKDLNGTLPLPTRIVIGVSHVLTTSLPFVIVGAVISGYLLRRWLKTDTGRAAWDRTKLRIPVFGKLVQKTAMARFAGTFSTLLRSGVPLLDALDITKETVNNTVIANGLEAVAEGAKQGESLTQRLPDHPVFPSMVVQMMSVGEETGALDDLLARIAIFFEQEVSATVDALTSLLEPIMIVVLGGAVGTMVISLYMPMFNIIKLIK
ncbi:type II secretion system F family protein [Acidiferrimicrobium sp. IK]|uniref:type II secretion system F family protein n=1 Tax=Acidiferrimicrobium sp. IK TaxID=2871700 RepID=UPI0021CAFDC1|nr:type II secretion system F family protein [Acidiferrimicrobium sp. IK]MCU4184832.1 type II secretion system F family protein [Acidiferrimicrobium sp. IK]